MQQLAPSLAQPQGLPERRLEVPASLLSACEVSPHRATLETFISNGFATTFNAHIHHFLPLLVGIQTHGLRAALGLRSARQPLFVEQYLDLPVDQALAASGHSVSRAQLVEIGNLYSAASRYTLPLLLGVTVALYVNNIDYVVFSATSRLRALFTANQLPLVYLAEADPRRLTPSHDSWGSYYATAPQVMALKLSHVIALMLQDPTLLAMYSQMAAHMPALSKQVRCLA